jgi:hypothetical protein
MSTAEYTRAWRARNQDKVRAWDREYYAAHREEKLAYKALPANRARADELSKLRRYGVSKVDYDALLERQGGSCAICHTTDWGNGRSGRPNIDHDHVTGKVRGLLCWNCNVAIGHFGDSKQTLVAALSYLDKQAVIA